MKRTLLSIYLLTIIFFLNAAKVDANGIGIKIMQQVEQIMMLFIPIKVDLSRKLNVGYLLT